MGTCSSNLKKRTSTVHDVDHAGAAVGGKKGADTKAGKNKTGTELAAGKPETAAPSPSSKLQPATKEQQQTTTTTDAGENEISPATPPPPAPPVVVDVVAPAAPAETPVAPVETETPNPAEDQASESEPSQTIQGAATVDDAGNPGGVGREGGGDGVEVEVAVADADAELSAATEGKGEGGAPGEVEGVVQQGQDQDQDQEPVVGAVEVQQQEGDDGDGGDVGTRSVDIGVVEKESGGEKPEVEVVVEGAGKEEEEEQEGGDGGAAAAAAAAEGLAGEENVDSALGANIAVTAAVAAEEDIVAEIGGGEEGGGEEETGAEFGGEEEVRAGEVVEAASDEASPEEQHEEEEATKPYDPEEDKEKEEEQAQEQEQEHQEEAKQHEAAGGEEEDDKEHEQEHEGKAEEHGGGEEGGGGEREEGKALTLDQWLEQECEPMKDLSPSSELIGEDIHPSLADEPVTQCHEWMRNGSEFVLKYVDLDGGTLLDWWNVNIAQGEDDVSASDLFSRAVTSLGLTIPDKLREAVEAGDDKALREQSTVLQYKNVFGAPSPSDETDPPPSPHSWVAGEGMYNLAPPLPKKIMSEERKYLLDVMYSREEVEAAIGRPLEDEEVQEEEEGKTASFEEWVEQYCRSMTFIPRKGDKTLTWDEVYPAQKDRSNPVTQCHVWMTNISPSVLMIVDLDGGTLLDWWNTHIGKGETETDLKKSTLFNRAVAGINDTVAPKLLEAVEAGVAEEIESQCLAVTIKNVFGAPPPPEGTTGCGEDGDQEPEPHSWVAGGDMCKYGPSHATSTVMSKDRKYIVGAAHTREQVEKALGRALEDDEVEIQAEEGEGEGQE